MLVMVFWGSHFSNCVLRSRERGERSPSHAKLGLPCLLPSCAAWPAQASQTSKIPSWRYLWMAETAARPYPKTETRTRLLPPRMSLA